MRGLKTRCSCASTLFTFQHSKRPVVSLTVTLLLVAMSAGAAVTPLSVPGAGVTVDFSVLPTAATGWSTASWAAGDVGPNTVTIMDIVANTNSAADIVGTFPTDTVDPTPTFPTVDGTTAFRWNSVAHFLESRPTGNSYQVLLLTLRNGSSVDQGAVTIDYDFGALFPAGTLETEDDGNKLAGFRLYWSLSGASGSWTHVPEVDGGRATAGHKSVTLTLGSAWGVGANMYLLWTDDNASTGSGGTAPGPIEGPYTIDNVAIGFDVCDLPLITSQPQALVHVESCRTTNLAVVATGRGLHYHWFHGTDIIPTATGPTLTLTSAQTADAGSYHVVITNCTTTVASSQPSTVVVDPDDDLPTVVSALAKADGFTYVVNFNETMDAASINYQGFHVNPLAGGGILEMTNAVLLNGTNLTLKSDRTRTANGSYELIIDPGLADCSQNVITEITTMPLTYEVRLIALENTSWKYNHEGIDLRLDFVDPGYDDSGWSNGISVLDAKSTRRTIVSGQNVMTQLPLHFGTFVADDVPVYYFRTHFSLPSSLSQITELHLRTFVDDFVVLYLNNDTTPFHADMGNGDPDVFRYGYSGGTATADANFLPTTGFYSKNPAALLDGDNFIAAKVFQQTNTSSDITFAIELTAVVTGFKSVGPQLTIVSDGAGHVTVTWPAGTGAQLYEASVVDAAGIGGPTGWSLAPGQSDGFFSATVPGAGGVQKFYSLRQ